MVIWTCIFYYPESTLSVYERTQQNLEPGEVLVLTLCWSARKLTPMFSIYTTMWLPPESHDSTLSECWVWHSLVSVYIQPKLSIRLDTGEPFYSEKKCRSQKYPTSSLSTSCKSIDFKIWQWLEEKIWDISFRSIFKSWLTLKLPVWASWTPILCLFVVWVRFITVAIFCLTSIYIL